MKNYKQEVKFILIAHIVNDVNANDDNADDKLEREIFDYFYDIFDDTQDFVKAYQKTLEKFS